MSVKVCKQCKRKPGSHKLDCSYRGYVGAQFYETVTTSSYGYYSDTSSDSGSGSSSSGYSSDSGSSGGCDGGGF